MEKNRTWLIPKYHPCIYLIRPKKPGKNKIKTGDPKCEPMTSPMQSHRPSNRSLGGSYPM